MSRYYYLNKASGRCVECGKKKTTSGILCAKCRKKTHERNKASRTYLRSMGLCVMCKDQAAIQRVYWKGRIWREKRLAFCPNCRDHYRRKEGKPPIYGGCPVEATSDLPSLRSAVRQT